MPFALPDNWNFGAALQINVGTISLNEGLSLALPAPVGSQVGDILYIMQPGTLVPGGGQANEGQTWMIMDKLVVGADGMMRTTSPPNLGIFNQNNAGPYFVPEPQS